MATEYKQLQHTADEIDSAIDTIDSHRIDNAIHVTMSERSTWNGKADKSEVEDVADDLDSHTLDIACHISAVERSTWNGKANASDIPSKTSALTNDSGFITKNVNDLVNYYTKTKVDELITASGGSSTSTTSVPTKTSELTNDSGFVTETTLTAHTGNTSNPHNVTKSQLGLGNVENKSSATIRGELTSSDVTSALGYTPSKKSFTKSSNILGASSNIDKYYTRSSCSVYSYVNTSSGTLCLDVSFTAAVDVAAGSGAVFATLTNYKPSAEVRTYIINSAYTVGVLAYTDGNVKVYVISGTLPKDTSLKARIEWHYI